MGKERYEHLRGEREEYLDRARKNSRLTLHTLIREESDNGSTDYPTPWQSLGARGVTNLGSNLLLGLFPINESWVRLLVSENAYENYPEEQRDEIRKQTEAQLSAIERTIQEEVEDKSLRPAIFETLLNLIVAGNALVYVQPDGNIRAYTLENYVVHRDVEGNLMDIVVKEIISAVVAKNMGIELPSDEVADDAEIELYTCVELQDDGEYKVWQEVKGEEIGDTVEMYEADDLPFLALRLTKITGQSYGRAYVDTVYGSLSSLENLTRSLVEGYAMMSKVIFMVDPATTTRAKNLSEAENGDFVNGRAADVSTLQVGKSAELNGAFQAAQAIEKSLSFAFNLLDASLPSGGRRTTVEVSAIVGSLEKVMAGTYTMLTSEFMRPLVKLIIKRLIEEKRIEELPEAVKLIISTGVSGLGRMSDLERLQQFVGTAQSVAPEAFAQYADWQDILAQLQQATGVKASVLKSKEKLAAEQEQAMQAQQAQQQMEQEQMQQQQQGRVIEKIAPQLVKNEQTG